MVKNSSKQTVPSVVDAAAAVVQETKPKTTKNVKGSVKPMVSEVPVLKVEEKSKEEKPKEQKPKVKKSVESTGPKVETVQKVELVEKPVVVAEVESSVAAASSQSESTFLNELMGDFIGKVQKTTESDHTKRIGFFLQAISKFTTELRTEYRAYEKLNVKNLKVAQKTSTKRKRNSGNRSSAGIMKPSIISDELAVFLGVETGSEMSRIEATKSINKYIRENGLQRPDNKRFIVADEKLTALLRLPAAPEKELSFFNLQTYLKVHFLKPSPVGESVAV